MIGLVAPSTILIAAALKHLRHNRAPLIDLSLMRIHTFRSALTGIAFHFTVLQSAPFLVPLLFEEVFHWSAVKAGSIVLFIFVGNVGAKSITTNLYSRFGFRRVLAVSTSGLGLTMAVLGIIGTSTPVMALAVILLLSGAARSVGGTGYSTVIFSDVPQAEMRHANTIFATAQQLSAAWGVAAGAVALRLGRPVAGIFGGQAGIHVDYMVAFLLMGCLALIATVGALRMHPAAGDVLRVDRAPVTDPEVATTP